MAADIAGFSRLVGIDEEGTLVAQRGHRTELIEPLLATLQVHRPLSQIGVPRSTNKI